MDPESLPFHFKSLVPGTVTHTMAFSTLLNEGLEKRLPRKNITVINYQAFNSFNANISYKVWCP